MPGGSPLIDYDTRRGGVHGGVWGTRRTESNEAGARCKHTRSPDLTASATALSSASSPLNLLPSSRVPSTLRSEQRVAK